MSKHSEQIIKVDLPSDVERPKRPSNYPIMQFGLELSDSQREHITQINKGVELARRRSEVADELEEQERKQILAARKQLRNN